MKKNLVDFTRGSQLLGHFSFMFAAGLISRGMYRVIGVDPRRERVELESERGKRFEFRPDRLRPQGEHDALRLYELKDLALHGGDRIRWTHTDHKRGLLNADQARIMAVGRGGVRLVTSTGIEHHLSKDDPMLKRLDLAYALNAHMAQGLTSDRGIAVMDSRERNLSNQQTFLVTITLAHELLDVGDIAAEQPRNP